jgi:hypothetical protein
MTQVELPPYRRSHSPLDLVVVKIIFGHIFEALHLISQTVATGAMSVEDNKPPKRFRQPPLKKARVPRYLCILYFIL